MRARQSRQQQGQMPGADGADADVPVLPAAGIAMDSDAIKALVKQALNAAVMTVVQQVINAVGTGCSATTGGTPTTSTAPVACGSARRL